MKNWYELYFGKTRTQMVQPPTLLRYYIRKYLIYENREGIRVPRPLRALPNGYTEVFFHLKGSQVYFLEKEGSRQMSCFTAGIFELNYPLEIDLYSASRIFKGISVTFTPRGVSKLLGTSVRDLTNRILNLEDLLGHSVRHLKEELEKAAGDAQCIRVLNGYFHQLLKKNDKPGGEEIDQITNILLSWSGPLSIDELAVHSRHSYKSLYRLFQHHMGVCPKMYLRIVRFNRACSILNRQPQIKWAELIHQCGYYDQSHFIREFRTIMKASPHHFLRTTGGHFYLNRAYIFT